jgi:hypothetical protein
MEQTTQNNTHTRTTISNKKKWATFSYYGSYIRNITDLFKHTNIHIAFRTTNTLLSLLQKRTKPPSNIYDRSGMYELPRNACQHSYVGQTIRSLKLWHKENISYIKNNNPPSACALHILQNKHEYGSIQETMTLLQPVLKSSCMNILEQFYIQQHQYNNTLTPEQNSGEHNFHFEIAYHIKLRPERNTQPSPNPDSLPPNTETHTRPTQEIPYVQLSSALTRTKSLS